MRGEGPAPRGCTHAASRVWNGLTRLGNDQPPVNARRPDLLAHAVWPADDDLAHPVVVPEAEGERLLRLGHESHRGLHRLDEHAARRAHLDARPAGVALAMGAD